MTDAEQKAVLMLANAALEKGINCPTEDCKVCSSHIAIDILGLREVLQGGLPIE